jgi:hypothetical protein
LPALPLLPEVEAALRRDAIEAREASRRQEEAERKAMAVEAGSAPAQLPGMAGVKLLETAGADGNLAVMEAAVGGTGNAAGNAGSSGDSVSAGASAGGLSAIEARVLDLSDAQRIAIQMMLSGESLVASASAAGVTRMTLYRWLKHDAHFQAAYNAWQQDATIGARTKLLALADRAVNTVANAVHHDARLALHLLKAMGMLHRPVEGSTDPKEIEERMAIDRRMAEIKRSEELLLMSLRGG